MKELLEVLVDEISVLKACKKVDEQRIAKLEDDLEQITKIVREVVEVDHYTNKWICKTCGEHGNVAEEHTLHGHYIRCTTPSCKNRFIGWTGKEWDRVNGI